MVKSANKDTKATQAGGKEQAEKRKHSSDQLRRGMIAGASLLILGAAGWGINSSRSNNKDGDVSLENVPSSTGLESEGKYQEAAESYTLLARAEGGEEAGYLLEAAAEAYLKAEQYEKSIETYRQAEQAFKDNGQESDASRISIRIIRTQQLHQAARALAGESS